MGRLPLSHSQSVKSLSAQPLSVFTCPSTDADGSTSVTVDATAVEHFGDVTYVAAQRPVAAPRDSFSVQGVSSTGSSVHGTAYRPWSFVTADGVDRGMNELPDRVPV